MTEQADGTGRDPAGPGLASGVPAQEAGSLPPPPPSTMPSPYLTAGESIPEAYLAPPQPGMPRYGSAPDLGGPGPQPFGPAQQPYRQQQYSPPGQRPGPRRPAFGLGARAQRDPALAGGWERLLACILDWLLIMVVSAAIFASPLLRVLHQLEHIANAYQNLSSPSAQAAISSFERAPSTVSTLLHFWLTVFVIALAYYWGMHALWGATLGKRVLGMRVVRAADRGRIGPGAAGIRTVVFLAGPAIFLFLTPVEILGGVLWLSDNLLLVLDRRTQSLHDKLAGTVVISQRRLQRQAGQSSPW